MLQQLRDQTQSTGFKVLVVAIILVLTLFGFGATNIFLGAVPNLATVGDVEITERLLSIETERERRRIIARMGAEFDPSDIDRLELQNYALDQLVNRQVVYQTTSALGLAFSDAEIDQRVRDNPVYQVGGEFNEALYRQQVQLMGFSPIQFIEEIRQGLPAELLTEGLTTTAFTQDWETGQAVSLLNQRRDIAYLNLAVSDYLPTIEVGEEDVAIRYQEDQTSYVTEPTVDVEWIELSLNTMRAQASISEDDAYLREVYEAGISSLADNAPRASAHILVVVDDVADEGSALEQIQDVAERLADGEEFAALAEELSQDPGSAPLGGDLGMMAKGSFDSAFEDALWSLSEVGDVSQPVRSEFGYHLIRLNEVGQVEIPSFAEEKERILAELREDAAAEAYDTAIEELEQLAFEERYSLTETATALGLAVQKVENVSQNPDSTQLPKWQLAGDADVIESLFSAEGLDGENSAVLSLDGDRAVVVRASDYAPAEQMTLEDVRPDIVGALKLEAALSQIETDQQSALAKLLEGASVSDVAASLGKRWETRELITRGGVTPQGSPEVPQFVLREAFALARPEPGEKSVGTASSSEGSALIVVTRVIAGDVDATAQVLIDQLEQQVVARDQQLEFAAFFAAAGQSVGVDRID